MGLVPSRALPVRMVGSGKSTAYNEAGAHEGLPYLANAGPGQVLQVTNEDRRLLPGPRSLCRVALPPPPYGVGVLVGIATAVAVATALSSHWFTTTMLLAPHGQ
jgi:hypothetical protein